ncbi:MAG: RNA-binding protein [Chrysiogenales bacterium]|nr:MAG: RNA-binding protein [Chrysiogenales bacterium]
MQGRTLYVGNLSSTVSKDSLFDLFSGYGSVIDVKIVGPNAFGFIEMSSQTEAENAKNSLHGHDLDGKELKIGEARPKNYPRGRNPRR